MMTCSVNEVSKIHHYPKAYTRFIYEPPPPLHNNNKQNREFIEAIASNTLRSVSCLQKKKKNYQFLAEKKKRIDHDTDNNDNKAIAYPIVENR